MTMQEILAKAREIYEDSQCPGAGCCGNIEGAMEYIDEAVAEMIRDLPKERGE